ncbi:Glycosyl hydrolases family 28 [Paenibacillus sp. PDC88]|nr:Glycosyl hydrolases family 28 [Paenibacillus sp. PDC88]
MPVKELNVHEIDGTEAALYHVELPDIPQREFQIVDFGAIGNGLYDNTDHINSALTACAQAGGGRVIIPAGIWLTGPILLQSRTELHLERGALVRFSREYTDYPLILSSYEGRQAIRSRSPLDGENLTDVAITGEGIFDGSGDAWRPVKQNKLTASAWEALVASGGAVNERGGGNSIWWPSERAMNGASFTEALHTSGVRDKAAYEPAHEYLRPNLLSLRRCKRVLLEGVTFQNSPAWNLHPWACEHVTIRQVNVRNPWYAQNGDGLDLDSVRHALVEYCSFDVGDDAICLKSGKDAEGRELGIPTEYVTIRHSTVYHGHGGFVIGSEMSGGVRHVRVSDCMFMGTDIGLRFKSARGRGGIVEDIIIERIRMLDITKEAISFSLFYEGKEGSGRGDEKIYAVGEGTPIFRNISIREVVCSGAQTAMYVSGLAEMPVEDISVNNYHVHAANGFICSQAKHLELTHITAKVDQGSLVSLHQCRGVELSEIDGLGADGRLLMVTGSDSTGIVYGVSSGQEECQISAGPGVRSGSLIRRR